MNQLKMQIEGIDVSDDDINSPVMKDNTSWSGTIKAYDWERKLIQVHFPSSGGYAETTRWVRPSELLWVDRERLKR